MTFGLDTTDDSIRRFRRRHGFQIPGVEKSGVRYQGDAAEVTTHVKQRIRGIHDELSVPGDKPIFVTEEGIALLDNPDQMLSDRGLDPAEWRIDDNGVLLNEWDGPGPDGTVITNYQAKFRAVRKVPYNSIMPVRSDGWVAPEYGREIGENDPEGVRLVVITGDQQAPFHDPELHRLFLTWLEQNQPDEGVLLGDLVDFPDISRHPSDPENDATVQECLQSGYDLLRGYVSASPWTHWDYIPGNHDERIRQYITKNAPAAYDLKRVTTNRDEGESVYSLSHLMRLDELGVNFVEPYGTYEDTQITLSKHLAVRHGWIVRQGSGASALKTLEQTGYSIIVGHTHRQSIVHHTVHDIDRKATTLLGCEAGCMCRIDSVRDEDSRRFPSYSVLPDWQQGFATATIWPDGKFRIDLATFVNGVLLWRNERYE